MVYLYSLLTAISTVDNKCDKLYPSWCVTLFLSVTVNVKHVTPMLCEQHRNVSEAGVSKRTWKTICEIICINASSVRHWKHLPYCAVHLTCEMLMLHIKVTNYRVKKTSLWVIFIQLILCVSTPCIQNMVQACRHGCHQFLCELWAFRGRHNTYYEYEAVPTT